MGFSWDTDLCWNPSGVHMTYSFLQKHYFIFTKRAFLGNERSSCWKTWFVHAADIPKDGITLLDVCIAGKSVVSHLQFMAAPPLVYSLSGEYVETPVIDESYGTPESQSFLASAWIPAWESYLIYIDI